MKTISKCGVLPGIIGRVKQAPHWGVQSRFRVIYIIYVSVGWYVCRVQMCRRNYVAHVHAQSHFGGGGGGGGGGRN